MRLKYLLGFLFSFFVISAFFIKPALADTVTLSGTVQTSSGSAVVGATVSVNDPNNDSTITDNNGNYSLNIPSGTYNVQVTPSSESGFSSTNAMSQNISGNTTLNFVLTPAGTVTLSGHLYDPLGNPLPNQQMYLSPTSGERTPIITTDSQGNFSFQVTPGTYTITINSDPTTENVGLNAPQTYTITTANYSLNQSVSNLNLTLPAEQVIVNTQNQSGNPVGNVQISTQGSGIDEHNLSLGSLTGASGSSNYDGNPLPSTNTTTGNATLWLFPSTSSTKYTLFADPQNGSGLAQTSVSNVNFTSNTTVNITVPPSITVSGHLYDPLGNPLANQQVYLLSSSGIRTDIASTDSGGNYSLQIAPGVWSLTINSDPNNNSSSLNAPQNYTITANNLTFNNNTTLNLTIPAEKVTVQTQDQVGNPISGVTVTTQGSAITVHNLTIAPNITNAQGSSNYTQNNISPESNSQGNATLWLFPNTSSTEYTLFGAPPTNSGLAQVTLSNVLINNSNTTLTMPFQEPTLSVSGVLDDPLGNPLPGQQMYLASSTGGRTPISTTDSNGNFLLQAPAGTYTLTINSDPTTQNVGLNAPQSYTLSIPNFQISQNTSNVDLTLPAKKVTVHVQNQFNNPVGNIAISTQGTAIEESNLSLSSTVTNATGSSNYTGNSLPSTDSSTGNAVLWLFPTTSSTDYNLIATPAQNSDYAQFTLNNVNVTGDQTELVSLQYNHATPITTASLSPTPYADGTYADPTTVTLSASAASGYTVANTYYTIDGGSPVTYATPFTVTGSGSHTITYWSVDNSGEQESANTKTFTITESYSVTGTVYNDANQNGFQDSGEQGVSGATVTVSQNNQTVATTTTDNNGNYTFSNVEAGTYTETLTVPDGYSPTTSNPVSFPLESNTTENFGIAQVAASPVVAINAGGDTQGNFAADTDYNGGTNYTTNATVDTSNVTNPAPTAVYQSVRYGNTFSYTIPNLTANGTYTLQLHFSEPYWGTSQAGGGGVGSRIFNVSVNGSQSLSNFDVYQAAGGANKAVMEQIPATADSNGNITVTFSSVVDNAMVSGIAVYTGTLPSPSPTPTPTPVSSLAISAGGQGSGSYIADTDYTGGSTYNTNASIDTSNVTNPAPQAVYQNVRYGNFSYTIPTNNPNSNYSVRLDFAEPYWNSAGSREFNVSINGTQVLNNFDVYQAAGGENKAVAEQFTTTSDNNGLIKIQFNSVIDNAMVSGIQISQQ